MVEQPRVPFDDLAGADLTVDRTYLGGTAGNTGDDPLARLLPVGNQGGFRYAGSVKAGTVRIAVLCTSGVEPAWPDSLDVHTSLFTYYGDNRRARRELHDTSRPGGLVPQTAHRGRRQAGRSRAELRQAWPVIALR